MKVVIFVSKFDNILIFVHTLSDLFGNILQNTLNLFSLNTTKFNDILLSFYLQTKMCILLSSNINVHIFKL